MHHHCSEAKVFLHILIVLSVSFLEPFSTALKGGRHQDCILLSLDALLTSGGFFRDCRYRQKRAAVNYQAAVAYHAPTGFMILDDKSKHYARAA